MSIAIFSNELRSHKTTKLTQTNHIMSEKNKVSRKEFLSYSAVVGAGAVGVLGLPSILTSCGSSGKSGQAALREPGTYYIPYLTDKAIDGKPLKAGLVGCGGRGSGAIQDLINSANGITVVALGDVLPDRMTEVKDMLKKDYSMDVPSENCFIGFDSYQKVIDAGVDIVVLTTPPNFRPYHFKYAVDKGVHSFLEKPIATDPAGYRTIMAAAKQADAKGICCVTGTQRRHQRAYVESFKQINNGLIGAITGGSVYWNQNMLWYKNREKNWSNMEWMIRDWVNWKWLSGDHIVEQHVHNIDVFTWFSGLKPVKATGFGSRHKRVTGDQYDNFSVDFEFENGVHMHSMCRQIDGTDSNVSEFVQGTLGSWSSNNNEFVIKDLAGNVVWKYDPETEKQFQQNNPYVLEHVDLVTHIRNGEPINEAPATALSSLAAVMGRESAYTGKLTTWDEMVASPMDMMPTLEMADIDMSTYTVQVPGGNV